MATLAAVAAGGAAIAAEQGLVVGEVPLTPIQHWFFEQALPNPHHWNQSLLLKARKPLDARTLMAAVTQLELHHDALRLRFIQEGGQWRQHCVSEASSGVFQRVDLSSVPSGARLQAMGTEAAKWQGSPDLEERPLWRVVWFDWGQSEPGRLLIVIHHLAVDGVSWRVLVEDLQTAYHQLTRGEPSALPHKTTSFKGWSERLREYVDSDALAGEAA